MSLNVLHTWNELWQGERLTSWTKFRLNLFGLVATTVLKSICNEVNYYCNDVIQKEQLTDQYTKTIPSLIGIASACSCCLSDVVVRVVPGVVFWKAGDNFIRVRVELIQFISASDRWPDVLLNVLKEGVVVIPAKYNLFDQHWVSR